MAALSPITGRMFVHSCHKASLPAGGDAVVVKEHVHHDDGTITPELRVIRNPKRKFWVTKKQHRTHTDKKEAEDLAHLDEFVVENAELSREVHKALYGYYPRGHVQLRKLCDSPYLYGADVAVETLIKARYQQDFTAAKAAGKVSPLQVSVGFLDIEESMHESNFGEITHITVTHETQVYTAILRSNFFTLSPTGVHLPGDLDELKAFSRRILQPMIDQAFTVKGLDKKKHLNAFRFEYYIGDTEVDLIRWVLSKVHENRTDFIGVWNLHFDMTEMLKALKRARVEPEAVFCPPELPKDVRYFRYVEDQQQVDHFTKKWHWPHCTGYAQFYDAMCLYSNLRTVIGKEVSYALDYITERNGVGRKLHFPELAGFDSMSQLDWHRRMQAEFPYHYAVYNQWDVVLLQLMEWKNQDVQSMYLLSGVSSLAKYTRQTRKAADILYFDWLDTLKKVVATVGTSMESPYDPRTPKVGGAVLRPERMDMAGLKALLDFPDLRTLLHMFVNDVDFTGMYPTVNMASNVSKETKLSTLIAITGCSYEEAQMLFSLLVAPAANAVCVGERYFGLPGYEEIDALYRQECLVPSPTPQ